METVFLQLALIAIFLRLLYSSLMTKVLFVCHGNICRSPMAEFIFKHLVEKKGAAERFSVSSSGVSSEEEGNDIYLPAKRTLRAHGIPFSSRRAKRITDREFADSDLVIALDHWNLSALERRFGKSDKLRMLLGRDVVDPWYTDDFETAYRDIYAGCETLLDSLLSGRNRA